MGRRDHGLDERDLGLEHAGGGEADRLAALRRTALLGAAREPGFDALTRAVQLGVGVPTALLSLVDVDRQFFMSCVGLAPEWEERRETPLSHSFCRLAVESGEELVIEDARSDARVSENLAIEDLGVIAYAGIPLRTSDGYTIGTLCAIDGQPRRWREDELALLRSLADVTAALIDARTDARTTRETRELVEREAAEKRRLEEQLHAERALRAREFESLAISFQRGLLPRLEIRATGVRLRSVYMPGERRMLLGGDFVDTFAHPDGRVSMLVGDVAGHGSEAAAFAVSLRAAWRALLLTGTEIAFELARLNEVARAERPGSEMFATVCSCSIAPSRRELVWSSAGHPLPLVLGSDVREAIGRIGPPLGVTVRATWPTNDDTLELDGAVMLYTDGLIEGRRRPGAIERFDVEGVIAAVRNVRRDQLDETDLRAIVAAATAANGAPLPDDVAIVAAKLTSDTRGQ